MMVKLVMRQWWERTTGRNGADVATAVEGV